MLSFWLPTSYSRLGFDVIVLASHFIFTAWFRCYRFGFPLHIHGLVSMLSFWHKTTQMHDDILVKQALNLITNDGQKSSEWAATVKFLLKHLDMENYFANPTVVDTKKFTSLCLTKFKKVFIEQWKMAISRERSDTGVTNKLRFYSRFKTVFEFELYLDYVNNFHVRKTIAKFRCSDHKLKIERGRHQNLEADERICDICKTDVETDVASEQLYLWTT